MKKVIVVLCIMLMLIFLTSHVFASLDSPVSIVPSYLVWADLYGVPDVDGKMTTRGEDENGINATYADCLCVEYDNSTFETRDIMMYYYTEGQTDSLTRTYQDLRVLALISAIEAGKPSGDSYNSVDAEKRKAIEIKENLDIAMGRYKDSIDDGKLVTFYMSKKGSYYITGRTDGNMTRYILFIA